MAAQSHGKIGLELRVSEITQPDFIKEVVSPLVFKNFTSAEPSSSCETSVVQNTGTGRITINYRFSNGPLIFGKLYSNDLGGYGYRVLKELWEGGLGSGESYQVSEPLCHLPEVNLLLTRAVPGVPLMSLIGQDGLEVLARIRQAARLLVRLHRLPLRVGSTESLWDSLKLFRIIRRLTKAAARVPHERDRFIGLVDALSQKAKQGSRHVPVVQTHGRYHYEHIFVDDETVSMIDLDRSVPSDPAKDLAEFVNMLRLRTLKETGSIATAETSTKVFLEEYLSHLPENAVNLPIYWGAFLLLNIFGYMKRYRAKDEVFSERMDFYLREFDAVLSNKFLPRSLRAA